MNQKQVQFLMIRMLKHESESPELIFLNTMRMMTATDKYRAYASLMRSKQAA